MALFCDFENVALGVRDANYDKFDIKKVLERLLLKGSIVVKKAYCDWSRYQSFKATMHEASFELIDIPHVRQSGKNSADIRLVVDALDLCYTKSHVDTFVIISGDSDFSPLVSKLRENAKQVIGVGVKQSTSDLLITNCDEFIFYDDLVRESQRQARREARQQQPAQPQASRRQDEEGKRRDETEARRLKAINLAVETYDALAAERGDGGKIWASVLKEAIKRRRPDFNESYFGFKAFGNLLEAAQQRGLLQFGRDDKSGAYVYRQNGGRADGEDETLEVYDPAGNELDRSAERGARQPAEARQGTEGRERRQGGRRRGGRSGSEAEPVREEAAAAGEAQTSFGEPLTQTSPEVEAHADTTREIEWREQPLPETGRGRSAEADTEATAQLEPAGVEAAPAPAKKARKQPARVARAKARAAQTAVTQGGQEAPPAAVHTPAAKTPAGVLAATPEPGLDRVAVQPAPATEQAVDGAAPAEPPKRARKTSTPRRAPRKRATRADIEPQ
ncbi:NYN domain-containing protein [Verticiella sediminum]